MEPGLLYLSPYGHAVKQGSLDTPNSFTYPRPNPATQDGSPHAMRPLREGLLLWDWASQIAGLQELFRRGVRLTRPNSLAYHRPNRATQAGSTHASRPRREGLLPALLPRLWGCAPQVTRRRELVRCGVRITRPARSPSVSQTQSCDSGRLPARLEAASRGPAACPATARGLSERACCLPCLRGYGQGAAGRRVPRAGPAWSQAHSTCRIL